MSTAIPEPTIRSHFVGLYRESRQRLRVFSQKQVAPHARLVIPRVAYDPFIVMCCFSVLAMVVLSLPFASQTWTGRSAVLDIVSSVCDPVLVSLLALAAAGVMVYRGLCPDAGGGRDVMTGERFICSAVVILLAFVLSLIVSVIFMVPFGRGRPPQGAETWLAALLLRWSPALSSSFWLLLQSFLLEIGLVYSRVLRHKSHQRARMRDLRRSEIWSLCLLLLMPFLTGFMRYLRGTGTFFDVGISLGLSNFFFWLVFFLSAKLFRRIHPGATGGLVSMTMLNIPIFVCLSRDLTRWSAVFIAVMFMLGLMKVFVHPTLRAPEPNLNQESLISEETGLLSKSAASDRQLPPSPEIHGIPLE